jgi:hypothetical protein
MRVRPGVSADDRAPVVELHLAEGVRTTHLGALVPTTGVHEIMR